MREVVQRMSDDELLQLLQTAVEDLTTAARECPESEWHEACFAATIALGMEVNERGLSARQALQEVPDGGR